MNEWQLPFPLLKAIRAEMQEEDATEEQIESVLLAYTCVTLSSIEESMPQKGVQWRCPCGEYNSGTRCGACHQPNYESMPQKGHCACGFTGGDVAHLCHVPQKGLEE